ncbi:MAG: HDOD domain-containing protein [Rhodocyclaceae bacterium]|nr:HDOD domain-containing protein [Rhodocyclaceae bacterium]
MNGALPNVAQHTYLERQPIVDRQGDTFGYELSYYSGASSAKPENSLEASSAVLAHVLDSLDMGWLPAGKRVFINAELELLTDADFLALLPDGKIVLDLHGDPASLSEAMLRGCDELKQRDIGIALDGAALAGGSPELLIRANFVKLDLAGSDSYSLYDEILRLADYPARKIAKRVTNGKEYKFCHGMGIDLFQGYFFTRPEIIVEKEMNTSIAQLVQLFELVGANAEPRDLEAVFKRDPALMVKLLGYINSAGMGVGRKVTSIHQAIVLLGYKQLYRWVALLLYTAGNTSAPAALMKTVLTRSRFIELLGRRVLPKHEQDNLFMIGMLSLLDVVFGQPLPKALTRLPLPDQIVRAILEHEGLHGRLLMLAEAAEQGDWDMLQGLAAELQLAAADINAMQLEALAWAESLVLR